MIELNIKNGHLQIDNNSFEANTIIQDIETLNSKYTIDTYLKQGNSGFWQIADIDDGKFSLQFYFQKEKLNWIKINMGKYYNFPAFTITEKEREMIRELLHYLKGERKYPWGSVSFSEDNKGGSVSVIVTYN